MFREGGSRNRLSQKSFRVLVRRMALTLPSCRPKELLRYRSKFGSLMNLFYMLERKDRNAAFDGDLQPAKKDVQGAAWRGLNMPAGSSITVPNARRHHTLRSWPDTCGWLVLAPEHGPDLEVSLRRSGSAEVVGRARVPAGSPGFV